MRIWMDLTNSLVTWKGGVVGIIRAELEIAKNMRKENPSIKFCKYQDGQYKEVGNEEISWLFENESVISGYLNRFGRINANKNISPVMDSIYDTFQWNNALASSPSRVKRFTIAFFLYLNKLPKCVSIVLKLAFLLLVSLPLQLVAIFWRGFIVKCLCFAADMLRITKKNRDDHKSFKHPFDEGDVIFSCGWFGSGKEEAFEKIKTDKKNIKVIYLIYDMILLNNSVEIFYTKWEHDCFKQYFEWAVCNCDTLLTGGRTAAKDIEKYCQKNSIPIVDMTPVKFGSDIVGLDAGDVDGRVFLSQHDIGDNYILSVGSFGGRKNYATLYRAIDVLTKRMGAECPYLVIVGNKHGGEDLYETISRDPNTKSRIKVISPSDAELKWLYENCMFSILASSYEGWSLTLPEALNYGKFVLAADNEPLRECGEDYCDYVDTYDPYAWAEKIQYYVEHVNDIRKREKYILENYCRITWNDSAKMILKALEKEGKKEGKKEYLNKKIYFDVTLTCAIATYGECKISGILRTELMMIKYLASRLNNIVFVAYKNGKLVEINRACFEKIINGESLDKDYVKCSDSICRYYGDQVVKAGVSAKWLLISSVIPKRVANYLWKRRCKKQKYEKISGETKKKALHIIPSDLQENSILFQCAPIGDSEYIECIHENIIKNKLKLCCIVYDFTPIIVPQTHRVETVSSYGPYLEYVYKNAALILYGGNTAQNDGKQYQNVNNLPEVNSTYIKFGSDISKKDEVQITVKEEKEILERLGVNGDYILAVGTIEQRKNYETLYRAYVRLVEKNEKSEIPQLIVAGHPGWNSKDFLAIYRKDVRVHEKMKIIEPSDLELDILYKNCKFTVLASLYEGWSLTLPESLHYGKFCLCCDTPALREIAGDLSDYVEKWDEVTWAEKIKYYYNHSEAVELKEQEIKKNWKDISWQDCAEEVARNIEKLI